ncbi:MAG: hypothetical protein Q7J06_07525, partial [Bacteroidales bacterium]|nr:hypothetical protein [Bacteroidales bacterium]
MQKRLIFILFLVTIISGLLIQFSFGDLITNYNSGNTLKNDVNLIADVNLVTGELSLSFPFMALSGRGGMQMQPTLYYNGGIKDSARLNIQTPSISGLGENDYSFVGKRWTLGFGSISYDRDQNKYFLNLPDGTSGEIVPIGDQNQERTKWQLKDNPFYDIARIANYGGTEGFASYQTYYYDDFNHNLDYVKDYWEVKSPNNKFYTFKNQRYYRTRQPCTCLGACYPRIIYQWDVTSEKDSTRKNELIYSYENEIAYVNKANDFRANWLAQNSGPTYSCEGQDKIKTNYIMDSYPVGIHAK